MTFILCCIYKQRFLHLLHFLQGVCNTSFSVVIREPRSAVGCVTGVFGVFYFG